MNKNVSSVLNQEENFTLEDLRQLTAREIEGQVRRRSIEYIGMIMEQEVELLCGTAFRHKKGFLAHRGGSESGSILLGGQRVKIRRPRVRKDGAEISLQTYEKLKNMDNITDVVFKMMINGTSTRSYNAVLEKFENDLGVSKSAVSRQFIKKSREYLNTVNSRRFPDRVFWAIMIDGIAIGGDVIIVILGVDLEGNKHFLGLSEGSTENSVIVAECLNNLVHRDIRFTERLVAVLDGAKALRKAVLEHFGERVEIQRCLNHKMRNVYAKLSKKYHPEFTTRIRQAYGLNDFEEARTEFIQIHQWLSGISQNAADSLLEGLDDVLTLHRIKMPPSLRKSFYTSNLIDSGFSNPRFKMNRVRNWIKRGDMIKRWAGAALHYQEHRFRKVKRFDLIEDFIKGFLGVEEIRIDKVDAA